MKFVVTNIFARLVAALLLTTALLPFVSDWVSDGSILLIGNLLFIHLLPLNYYYKQTMFATIRNKPIGILLRSLPFITIVGVCVGVEFISAQLIESTIELTHFIPTQILPWGLLFWLAKLEAEREATLLEAECPTPEEASEALQVETIDSVSVKVRKQLHIIPVETITYLQGEGDYVAIVVGQERFLKEETLKYFEAALPTAGFTRIHRSYLVNNRMIASIELFGKQQYLIEMKNGDKIKATLSGYRLLRTKLNI